MINGAFNLISLKGGDHWKLNQEELTMLSTNLNDVLDMYNVDISKGSPIIVLVGSVLIVVTPRIVKSRNVKPKTNEDEVTPQPAAAQQKTDKPTTDQSKPTNKILTNEDRLKGIK